MKSNRDMIQERKYDWGASSLTSIFGPRAFTKAGRTTLGSESLRLVFISR